MYFTIYYYFYIRKSHYKSIKCQPVVSNMVNVRSTGADMIKLCVYLKELKKLNAEALEGLEFICLI